MARESTLRYTFQLQTGRQTAAVLETPGVSKEANCKVNISNTDPGWAAGYFAVGNLVEIEDSGLEELDGKLHVIRTSVEGSEWITLGTDTSGSTGTVAAFGTIKVYSPIFEEVKLSEFSPSPGTPGEIDATTMADPDRVNLPGLSSPGTASFTGMFDLEDDGMLAMNAAKDSGDPTFFVGKTRAGQMAVFHGAVSAFSISNLTVEGAVQFTGAFTLDESPYYMMETV